MMAMLPSNASAANFYDNIKKAFIKDGKTGTISGVPKQRTQPAATSKAAEAPIIEKVRGFALLGLPNQVKKQGVTVNGISIDKAYVPMNRAIRNILKSHLGRPLTLSGLNNMTRRMVESYRKAGYQTVSIVTPPQNVKSGTVQILVITGRMGDLNVKGEKFFHKNIYLQSFLTKKGEVLRTENIIGDLRYLNRNPFRRVDLEYTPGSAFGQTNVTLHAQESRPKALILGLNNSSNDSFGETRMYTGFQLGNLWRKDHQLLYRITSNVESSKMLSHYAQYRMPMRNRKELRLTGTYSKYDGVVNTLNQSGDSATASIDWVKQLKPLGSYAGDLILGVDYRHINGDLVFAGTNVRDEQSRYTQLKVGYGGERANKYGTSRINAMLIGAIDGDIEVNAVKTNVDHTYLNVGYHRRSDYNNNTRLFLSLAGQYAFNRLPSAESYYLGGSGSVRGWDQSEVRADSGLSMEVSYFSRNLIGKRFQGQSLRAYGFVDAGYGKLRGLAAGVEDQRELVGAGLGLQYQLGRKGTLDLSYGKQLHEEGFDDGEDGRFHAALNLRF